MRSRYFNAVVVGALAAAIFVARPLDAAPPVAGQPLVAAGGVQQSSRAGSVAAQGSVTAAIPNIDACVARLDPQLDIGYDRIAARCPDLMRQFDAAAWAPWLPRGWKEPGNDLSAGGLREFRELIARESGSSEATSVEAPDVRNLQPILAALAGSHDETGWSRFKSWLRSILERREQPTDESWLTRMVSHAGLSQSVIRLVSYAALAAVVVLAAIILVNEVRTAGLISKRRGRSRKRARAAGAATSPSWATIEQAPLLDRPRLLLELIVRRLSDRGVLPPAGALTVRELTRAARLPDAEDRLRLAELALATERVRYSGAGAQAEQLDEPIARGRELFERLEAGAGGYRDHGYDAGHRPDVSNGDQRLDAGYTKRGTDASPPR